MKVQEPCDNYGPDIEAYVDGELPADRAGLLTAHVAGCQRCAAYQAGLVRLRDGMSRLTLVQTAPDVAQAVVGRIKRGLRLRGGVLAAGLLILKVLDVCGLFGSGLPPRLVVAAIVVTGLLWLRINPFRLVRPEELVPTGEAVEGVAHVRA